MGPDAGTEVPSPTSGKNEDPAGTELPAASEPSEAAVEPEAPAAVEPEAPVPAPADAVPHSPLTIPKSRAGLAWKSLLPAFLAVAVMLVFVFQNLQDAKISFLTFSARFPLALALLVAAALGALVVFFLGSVRIVQLRKAFRRHQATRPTTGEEP